MNSTTLGLTGLACITAAIGFLAGPWWALLAIGVALVGLAYVAHTWEQHEEAPREVSREEAREALMQP